MSPVLFDLPGLGPVRAWGTLLYLGICLAMWVGSRRMRAAGYTGNHMLYIGTIALVGGILGGKLLYILQYGLAGSTQLTGQGMVSFGGWALASAGVLSYLWLRGLPVAAVADTLAPSLAVGEAVGRVGCFLNGCCYGDLCKLPWGVKFPTLKGEIAVPFQQFFEGLSLSTAASQRIVTTYAYPNLHPTQLYSAAAAGLLFFVLIWWSSRKKFDGEILLGFGLLYAAARFLIEIWRSDTPVSQAGLSPGQTFSLGLFLSCLGLVVYNRQRAGR